MSLRLAGDSDAPSAARQVVGRLRAELDDELVNALRLLATELRAMATWLGLDDVRVTRRGDLAPALARAVRAG